MSTFSILQAMRGKSELDTSARRSLPDDPGGDEGDGLVRAYGWAEGMIEGCYSDEETAALVKHTLASIDLALDHGLPDGIRVVESACDPDDALHEYAAEILSQLRLRRETERERIRELGRAIATESEHRQAIILGLVLLAPGDSERDRDVLLTLGSHDEFTWYAIFAANQSVSDAEDLLFEMAKLVDGWGRIQLVRQFESTVNPAIRDWLLRDGFRNTVKIAYSVCSCAIGGRLLETLEATAGTDDSLLESAAEIIYELMEAHSEGDGDGIYAYEQGIRAALVYLQLALHAQLETIHLITADCLHSFASYELKCIDEDTTAEEEATFRDLEKASKRVIDREGWYERISIDLKQSTADSVYRIANAAKAVGLDPWERFFELLQSGEDHWAEVMRTHCEEKVQRVIDYAMTVFDLDNPESGDSPDSSEQPLEFPASLVEFAKFKCLIEGLRRFSGMGQDILAAALEHPSYQASAMRVLKAWETLNWPEGTVAELHDIAENADDEHDRKSARELLQRLQDA